MNNTPPDWQLLSINLGMGGLILSVGIFVFKRFGFKFLENV